MNDFIAIIAAQNQTHEQFRHDQQQILPDDISPHAVPARTGLRLRLSAALHALANAIEPAPPASVISPDG